MPRLPRIDAPGVAQHVIQRGNNRQLCFGDDSDIAAYAQWLKEYAEKYHVEIHAWVFMSNHIYSKYGQPLLEKENLTPWLTSSRLNFDIASK